MINDHSVDIAHSRLPNKLGIKFVVKSNDIGASCGANGVHEVPANNLNLGYQTLTVNKVITLSSKTDL